MILVMVETLEKCKIARVNWYKLLYEVNDEKLIKFFWRWFNNHKVKSKKRAARCVLIRYYSTTPAPKIVQDAFRWYGIRRVSSFDWINEDWNYA